MKSSVIKKIVVRISADNEFTFEVDSEVHDDVFLEAATRAMETLKTKKYAIIHAFTQCWEEKTPKKSYIYNSYKILTNAGRYRTAELLREKFKKQTDCDLKNEPLHARKLPRGS